MSAEFSPVPIALAVGAEMPPFVVGPLSRADFVRYAGASGDFNPIHYDDGLAREAGYPSVFGMGMLPAGILGSRLVRWVGPDSLRSYRVRFSGQFWPGDELTCSGRVVEIGDELGETRATISLRVATAQGTEVLVATASVAIAPPAP